MGLKRSSWVARFAKDASGMLFSFAGIWSAMVLTIMNEFVMRGGTLIEAVQAAGLAHAGMRSSDARAMIPARNVKLQMKQRGQLAIT
jgi:hypothetical protein